MQDREIRFNLCYVTKDAPQQQASLIVVKYTGEGNAPQWMDTEPGTVFGLNNIMQGTQVKQTILRHCALYRRTSPPLRVAQTAERKARRTTRGTST